MEIVKTSMKIVYIRYIFYTTSGKGKLAEIFWGSCLRRHDLKVCRRTTGRAWAEEKIYRAVSARPDVPREPSGHNQKRHEARDGRAGPARPKSHL